MRIEWDDQKYWINLQKHGIRFEDTVEVFYDLNAIDMMDEECEESRFIRIGMNTKRGILVVVYCERDQDTIRVISARKATKLEEWEYEEAVRF